MTVTNSPCQPEPGTSSEAGYMNEKGRSPRVSVDDNSFLRPHSSQSIMACLRYCLLVGLLFLASISMCYVAASPPHRNLNDARRDPSEQSSFSALLSSVSDASLHDVLHKCVGGKYKPGVYSENRSAVEAVQKEDAELATSIVELAKRQQTKSSNSSTSTSISTSTSTTVVTSTPTTTVTTPTSPGTVSLPSSPLDSTLTSIVTSTLVVFPSPSPSVSPDTESMATSPTESTLAISPTLTTVETTHTDPSQVSDSSSASATTSSAEATSRTDAISVSISVSVSPTPTTIIFDGSTITTAILSTQSTTGTTTAAEGTGSGSGSVSGSGSGSTAETTAAGQSSFTSLVLYTTTLPNGARSTYTSTTVIVGQKPTPATATGATGTPALQNVGVTNSFSSWGLVVPGILGAMII